jgi:hypothetical protein
MASGNEGDLQEWDPKKVPLFQRRPKKEAFFVSERDMPPGQALQSQEQPQQLRAASDKNPGWQERYHSHIWSSSPAPGRSHNPQGLR